MTERRSNKGVIVDMEALIAANADQPASRQHGCEYQW